MAVHMYGRADTERSFIRSTLSSRPNYQQNNNIFNIFFRLEILRQT